MSERKGGRGGREGGRERREGGGEREWERKGVVRGRETKNIITFLLTGLSLRKGCSGEKRVVLVPIHCHYCNSLQCRLSLGDPFLAAKVVTWTVQDE